MATSTRETEPRHTPWNKGKLIGQKHPLKLKDIWAIRIRLQAANNARELALFNLAIDSKLLGCDLVQPHGRWWHFCVGAGHRHLLLCCRRSCYP